MKNMIVRSRTALLEFIGRVRSLEIESGIDLQTSVVGLNAFTINAKFSRKSHSLTCAVIANGQPRFVRMAILQLFDYLANQSAGVTPILIAPFLSPVARQICRDKGVGFFDLEGNAWIEFDGVYIDHQVSNKPPSERRAIKSIFKPKSARVLLTLLCDPSRPWRVADLARASNVSLGHVSNVRTVLMGREWAQATGEGVLLSDPNELLNAWAEVYEPPAGEQLKFYTTMHGRELDDAVRKVLSDPASGRVMLASYSAAQWIAPYGRTSSNFFYADRRGLDRLAEALHLTTASMGENTMVVLPVDASLFEWGFEPAPGMVCTSPVHTYLDLYVAGERGREAAQHLRKEKLAWLA